jgi:hypothetical protein
MTVIRQSAIIDNSLMMGLDIMGQILWLVVILNTLQRKLGETE